MDDDDCCQADGQAESGLRTEWFAEREGSPDCRDRGHEEHGCVDLGDSGAPQGEPVQPVSAEGRQGYEPGDRRPERELGGWLRGSGAHAKCREDDGAGGAVDGQRHCGRDPYAGAAFPAGQRGGLPGPSARSVSTAARVRSLGMDRADRALFPSFMSGVMRHRRDAGLVGPTGRRGRPAHVPAKAARRSSAAASRQLPKLACPPASIQRRKALLPATVAICATSSAVPVST